MIDFLQIICIWIVGLSATAAVSIVLAIAVYGMGTGGGNRYICRIPSCRAHDHIRSDQPSYMNEYDFGHNVVAEPVEKDPYLEYGEADVEVLLS